MATGLCMRLGVGLLLLVVAGPALAQCPDGTPPPCGRRATPARPAPNSVAVLAFQNAARDTSLEWLGDGLAEEVATQLGAAVGLTVRGAGIVRNASRVAAGDPRRLGQLVSVRYVVEGSYRRVGERVRVAARLLALPAGDQRWGRVYDRPRDSLAALSGDIAQDLATALGARARRAERRLSNPQAYEAYQRGRFFFLRYDILTARSLFEQAIRHDSTYAPAWAGLAMAWSELADVSVAPLEAYPQSREAAQRALVLDSTIPGAYVALAFATSALDRDCRRAEGLADRALVLDSTLPEAWLARSWTLMCQRRSAEALEAAGRVWPLDSLSGYSGGWLLYLNSILAPQRLPHVFALVRQRLDPDMARAWDAYIALQRRDCGAAEQLMRPLGAENAYGEWYVEALVCLGRRTDADSVVRAAIADTTRRYVNAVSVAQFLLDLGDHDGAIRWLERGADEHTLWAMGIHLDVRWDPLRADPRFVSLERRLGLQP